MADILITDLTNGAIATNADGELVWDGTGILDILMKVVNENTKIQWDSGRIKGQEYATVYLGSIQTAMQQSVNYVLQEQRVEADTSIKEYQLSDILPIQKAKAQEELDLMLDTHTYKVDLANYQSQKALEDKEYVEAQTTALNESVVDNRRIKALDSLADTYGTFGAGGLTMSSDMWEYYFDLAVTLAGGTAPTTTTVVKVT